MHTQTNAAARDATDGEEAISGRSRKMAYSATEAPPITRASIGALTKYRSVVLVEARVPSTDVIVTALIVAILPQWLKTLLVQGPS